MKIRRYSEQLFTTIKDLQTRGRKMETRKRVLQKTSTLKKKQIHILMRQEKMKLGMQIIISRMQKENFMMNLIYNEC